MFNAKASPLVKGLLLVVGVLLMAGSVGAAEKDKIAARLKQAGDVCVFGEECAKGLKVPGVSSAPKTPDQVYNTFCQACHASGANKAPIYGNAEAWKPRIAKGVDALYTSALNGFNNGAMPPRGTCADCSDAEVKATVDYLVKAAKK